MAFPLQDTTRAQATRDVMHLRPLGARLTATPAALILTDAHDLFNLGANAIQAADLCARQRQAVGGLVLFAVSDHQHFAPSAHAANLGPGGVPPLLTDRVAIEPAVLLQATHKRPAIGAKPLQQRLRRLPASNNTDSGQQRRRLRAYRIAAPLKNQVFTLRAFGRTAHKRYNEREAQAARPGIQSGYVKEESCLFLEPTLYPLPW
jgi:hypothetical protein